MQNDEEIILKQRTSFKNFMQKHKLRAFSWARKAGISEATIRNYINGLNKSLTSLILEKLAQSINVSIVDLIGSEKSEKHTNIKKSSDKFDQNLFIESFIKAEELIEKSNLKASPEERAKILLALYELSAIADDKEENKHSQHKLGKIIKKRVS